MNQAASSKNPHYAGDISPEEAYQLLNENGGALVDVRTVAEWQFTGVPDVSKTEGKLLMICWKNYPDFSPNPKFLDQLSASEGIGKDTPLFFICRSGGRSTDAAIAMTAAGYANCYNVSGGFEGEPDAQGHRGRTQGWKAKHLPWKQG